MAASTVLPKASCKCLSTCLLLNMNGIYKKIGLIQPPICINTLYPIRLTEKNKLNANTAKLVWQSRNTNAFFFKIWNERRGQAAIASNSGGLGFKSQSRNMISWGPFVVFLKPSRQIPGQHIPLGHSRFLLYPYHFIIYYSSYHLTLYTQATGGVNK